MFSIGELSMQAGVKVPTIRYYEQVGLIDRPARTAGNQRRYSHEDLQRLSFIRHGRDLGLPIDAIRQLIRLSNHPGQPCEDADRIAREHLRDIRDRIRRMKRLEKELARIAGKCSGEHVADCYVIRALSDHALCGTEH